MMSVICSSPKLHFDVDHGTTYTELRAKVRAVFKHDDFYLVQNGKLLQENGQLDPLSISVVCRVLGGKGGFGSMLRAIGAQIEKTTNREACRDLSGRRLRDINEELRLKNWIAQQAARESESKDKRRLKLEKIIAEPSLNFDDKCYENDRSQLTDSVSDAFEMGIAAASSGEPLKEKEEVSEVKHVQVQKRKNEASDHCKKKRRGLWLTDEMSDSEEETDDDDDNDSLHECVIVKKKEVEEGREQSAENKNIGDKQKMKLQNDAFVSNSSKDTELLEDSTK